MDPTGLLMFAGGTYVLKNVLAILLCRNRFKPYVQELRQRRLPHPGTPALPVPLWHNRGKFMVGVMLVFTLFFATGF